MIDQGLSQIYQFASYEQDKQAVLDKPALNDYHFNDARNQEIEERYWKIVQDENDVKQSKRWWIVALLFVIWAAVQIFRIVFKL